MTDFALANRQYMAGRNDLDLVLWQTAAKERIRWLSVQLANTLAAMPTPSDQEKRISELEEALQFYADESAWNQPPIKTIHHELLGTAYENQASKVRWDRGRIARSALSPERSPS